MAPFLRCRYLGRRATEGADDDDEPSPEETQPVTPLPPMEDGEAAPTPEHTAAMISRMSAMSADIIRRYVRHSRHNWTPKTYLNDALSSIHMTTLIESQLQFGARDALEQRFFASATLARCHALCSHLRAGLADIVIAVLHTTLLVRSRKILGMCCCRTMLRHGCFAMCTRQKPGPN